MPAPLDTRIVGVRQLSQRGRQEDLADSVHWIFAQRFVRAILRSILNTERSVPIRNRAPKTYASDNPRPVFGREREVGLLSEAMRQSGPRVIHVHGISGIGKSALISEFAAIWRSKKRTVLLLDGRTIEPTESGFLHELSRGLRIGRPTLSGIVRMLSRHSRRIEPITRST